MNSRRLRAKNGKVARSPAPCHNATARSADSKRTRSRQLGGSDRAAVGAETQANELDSIRLELEQERAARIALEARLEHDGLHDSLTGLANRRWLATKLASLIERQRSDPSFVFALAFIDINRFNLINDSLGHDAGDELLTAIAQRLMAFREHGREMAAEIMAARFDGDVFAVLMVLNPQEDAHALAVELQKQTGQALVVAGQGIHPKTSIGIVLSNDAYSRAEQMMRDANVAMCRAKRQSGASHIVFDPAMHRQIAERFSIETDLRQAVDRQQFWLAYQPIVNLTTGQLSSLEALLRWNHPRLGPMGPGQFLDIAEETGVLLGIERWVLDAAARQIQAWTDEFGPGRVPAVNVNLSRWRLLESDVVEQLNEVIGKYSLDPAQLRIEVTETTVTEQPEAILHTLQRLRETGVSLQMDDFGTGYSSLSYLHEYPFDVLKIDRRFLQSLGASRTYAAVVQAVVTLAHNLDMEVTAEGIETADQLAQILSLDCDYGQGYFFAKPLPPDQLRPMLRDDIVWYRPTA